VTAQHTLKGELLLPPKYVLEFFKPARLEIYESLQVSGPGSISELAQRLGRAPDSLYYHVRKLVKIGVLQVLDRASGEGKPGRNGVVYGLTCVGVSIKLDPNSKPSREALISGAASVIRLAQRDMENAVESRDVRTEGKRKSLHIRRMKVRLKDRQLVKVNALLAELFETLQEHTDSTEGRLFALTMCMSPLEESTRN
jgi:predicted ArsR family transcriptional regulator